MLLVSSRSVYDIWECTSLEQVSYRFFELTNKLKNAFVPAKDNARLYQMAVAGAVVCVALYAVALLTIHLPKLLVCPYTSLISFAVKLKYCLQMFFSTFRTWLIFFIDPCRVFRWEQNVVRPLFRIHHKYLKKSYILIFICMVKALRIALALWVIGWRGLNFPPGSPSGVRFELAYFFSLFLQVSRGYYLSSLFRILSIMLSMAYFGSLTVPDAYHIVILMWIATHGGRFTYH